MMQKRTYLTTAIPYVNAAPHIGFALEAVQADVIARARRREGREVYFLSGTDENAIKNVAAAEAEKIPVRELVDRNSMKFKKLLESLDVSNDGFVRTTDSRHHRAAQALWNATKKDIYKKSYSGLYCTGCEAFYDEHETRNGECPEHPGKKLERIEEENYFFKLSSYAGELKRLISKGILSVVPETRKREILALIDRGLMDFSVSRPATRSKGWGVPVPGDESQTIYVWYDALTNYISALGYPDRDAELYRKFWESESERMHVIGKGITRFHALYWPAMLLSAGLPLPIVEFVHGYVTSDGRKMSKTLGNVVDPFPLIERYGADAVRYYLLREIPAYEDGDWSEAKFRSRYNGDLANGLGNFAARTTTLAAGMDFDGVSLEAPVEKEIERTKTEVGKRLDGFRFNEALSSLWEIISFGDAYANRETPWAEKDGKEKARKVFQLVAILDNVAALLVPFLPATAEKITSAISWEGKKLSVKKIEPLFPRLD